MSWKFINERTLLKLLVEKTGILFSITLENRAFYFFISSRLIGIRVAPTTDPYPGIVEICGYDIAKIVQKWSELKNVKLKYKIPKTPAR